MATITEDQTNILIVEDEPTLRFAFEATFISEGYNVASAENGLKALNYLDSGQSVDLMVLDFRMPEMDGLELVQQLRKRNKTFPTILASAFMDTSTIVKAAYLGIVDYVKKPTTPAQLRNITALTVSQEKTYSEFNPDTSITCTTQALAYAKCQLRRHQPEEARATLKNFLENSEGSSEAHIGAWYILCSHLCSIDKKAPNFASENFYQATDLMDQLTSN